MLLSNFLVISAAKLCRGDTIADDSTKKTSDLLLKVGVTVISNEECESIKGIHDGEETSYDEWFTENMLCAMGEFLSKSSEFSSSPSARRLTSHCLQLFLLFIIL